MSANLLYKNISSTYQGLLHAQGKTLPAAGQINITDGTGVASALSLGKDGSGATITGSTVVDEVYADVVNTTTLAASSIQVYGDAGVNSKNAPKAWVNFFGSTGIIANSYNVASVVPAPGFYGQYIINFATPLSSANYAVSVNIEVDNIGAPAMFCSYVMSTPVPTASAFKIDNYKLAFGSLSATRFYPEKVSVVVY
jgi:hypothetical protein